MQITHRTLLGLALTTILGVALAAPGSSQPAPFKQFIGSWELIGFTEYSRDGKELTRPMVGRLIYDDTGGVAAQLMPTDRTPAPPEASSEERWLANRRYISYFGSWSLTPKEQRVTHSVEGSLLQRWLGLDLHRYYDFPAENVLRLSLKREGRVISTLTWRRLEN